MQWKDYIAAITQQGIPQSQIARLAGCSQPTISDLASGKTKEPRHSLGEALLEVGRRYGVKAPKTLKPTSSSASNERPATQEAAHG